MVLFFLLFSLILLCWNSIWFSCKYICNLEFSIRVTNNNNTFPNICPAYFYHCMLLIKYIQKGLRRDNFRVISTYVVMLLEYEEYVVTWSLYFWFNILQNLKVSPMNRLILHFTDITNETVKYGDIWRFLLNEYEYYKKITIIASFSLISIRNDLIVFWIFSIFSMFSFYFDSTDVQMSGLTKNPLAGLAALGLAGMAPSNTGGLNPTGKLLCLFLIITDNINVCFTCWKCQHFSSDIWVSVYFNTDKSKSFGIIFNSKMRTRVSFRFHL